MPDEDDLVEERVRALSVLVADSYSKGLSGKNLVAMLLSETVRNYKKFYNDRNDTHLVSWIHRTFSYRPDAPGDDGWGSN